MMWAAAAEAAVAEVAAAFCSGEAPPHWIPHTAAVNRGRKLFLRVSECEDEEIIRG